MHIGILAAEGVEDLEFWVTAMRLREAGARVTSIGLAPGTVHGKNGLAVGVDAAVGDVDGAALDGLVVPGGWMPDKLRRSAAILDLVRAVHAAGRPIGIICHGGPHRDLGRDRRRRPGNGLPGDPRRPGQRRRHVGGRARLPGRHPGLGPGRGRHPRVLPGARGRPRRQPRRVVGRRSRARSGGPTGRPRIPVHDIRPTMYSGDTRKGEWHVRARSRDRGGEPGGRRGGRQAIGPVESPGAVPAGRCST